jgi:hypothetical protein
MVEFTAMTATSSRIKHYNDIRIFKTDEPKLLVGFTVLRGAADAGSPKFLQAKVISAIGNIGANATER